MIPSTRPLRALVGALVLLLTAAGRAPAQLSVTNSPHNLSASGPGLVRAASDQRICVFCHAPHHTGGATPLWNRTDPVGNYTIYDSSTFDATPGQPTGVSKYCLSCHDGTIALGAVLSQEDPILMGGSQHMPWGRTNLGTDLSDDHPISFHYTQGLAASDLQLRNPALLPQQIRLDGGTQVQCTTCHDAHDNQLGNFLVLSEEFGTLCVACHDRTGWQGSPHRTSGALVPGGHGWPYSTVAQNSCLSCHRPHSAGQHERLLISPFEEQNCLSCHNGQVATHDIVSQLGKTTRHDPRYYEGRHDPVETGMGALPHVECSDCHNPHAAEPLVLTPGYVPIGNTLLAVRGTSIGGAPVAQAQFEYEVCLRCHSDNAVNIMGRITRQVDSFDLRLDFSPSNPSFHPVAAASVNPDVPSLKPGIPPGTVLRCTDCHNNDQTRRSGGSGPDGPHGSIHDFLLEENYTTTDPNHESAYEYALCYKCHERSSILGDESFSEHETHLDHDVACSSCHDPHGVKPSGMTGSDHTHLINFDLSVVQPYKNQLWFKDLGRFRGSCTLMCHGEEHDNEDYGPGHH